MTMRFLFRAMTEERHRPAAREMLQKSKGELLPVVLDILVAQVDRTAFAQLQQVAAAILRPTVLPGKKCVAQFFARSEIRHPDVVTILRQTTSARAARIRNPSRSRSIGVSTDFVRTIRYAECVAWQHQDDRESFLSSFGILVCRRSPAWKAGGRLCMVRWFTAEAAGLLRTNVSPSCWFTDSLSRAFT